VSKHLLPVVVGIALAGIGAGAQTRPTAPPAAQAAPAAPAPSVFTADDLLNVVTASVLDLSDDGRYAAVTTRRTRDNAETDNRRYGDPSYLSPSAVRLLVIDTETGRTQAPLADLSDIRQAAWSHDGRRLSFLQVVRPAPASEWAVRLRIWDRERNAVTDVPVKGDDGVAVNSALDWSPDDRRLVVALRSKARDADARARFRALTDGPVIVQNAKDPFLEWDELNRASRWRSLAEIDVATGAVRAVMPEKRLLSYAVARDGSFITFQEDVTEKTDYDVIGGSDAVLKQVAVAGGEPKTIAEAKDLKGLTLRWSDDGRTFAYAKKGEVFVQRIDETKPRSLTPPPPKKEGEKPADAAPAKDATAPKDDTESFAVGPISRDAATLLITSKKGWYIVDVATAARTQVVTLDADEEKNPRMEAVAWAPDGAAIYVTWSARDRWERGFARLDAATKTMTPLVKDARLYSGARFARNGARVVFSMTDGDRPADLFVASADFSNLRRLTDLNGWMAGKALPASELVSYRDADGKVLYGVLRYPVGYEKGKRYPTVFELYETFFDNGFNARAAFLAAHGYAVFHPSVNLVVGRPGEAWVKGVTSAANRLIEMGIADPDRLGVHGTSYGGYATVLLLTQTDRFKAAINVSGKVDMVSFYTDSPRLGVRNTHAPEKSQDRIGGTLWEYPERYLEHSAILHADRITTPLLCITGDQDPNVPSSQSREIYYALRRLGKDVEWARYVNGAHRPPNSAAESVDFEQRILAWYDKYLKPKPVPKSN
jgi:dipeptidyl aminopeptidase/acylaminoacyl peptidase